MNRKITAYGFTRFARSIVPGKIFAADPVRVMVKAHPVAVKNGLNTTLHDSTHRVPRLTNLA
jgi:hypothetical protein